MSLYPDRRARRGFSMRLDIPALVAAIVLISVFAMAVRVPASPDMWWHLRSGEVQWRTRAVLKSDVYSHTIPGQPWTNRAWLFQLGLYGLYALGGFPALALGVAALVTAIFGLIALAAREACWRGVPTDPLGRYGPFWRALVVLWAALSTGRAWTARPQLATMLLTAAWILILERHRSRGTPGRVGLLWWLPPLMVLWVNLHGGYVVGLMLLAAEIGGVLLEAIVGGWQGTWARLRPLVIVVLLSVAGAALLNPWGPYLILAPLESLGSTAQQQYISEWASPDFHAADMLPFLALMLGTWSAAALGSGRDRRPALTGATWLGLLVFSAMALRSARYLGVSALVMAPILARCGAQALSRFVRAGPSTHSRGIPALNWALLVLILAAAAIKVAQPLSPAVIDRVQRSIFPLDAAAYLRAHDTPPTLFNDYGWGGYLIWALYPDVPVFIDGRADPYGDALIVAYRQAITAQREWEGVLDAHGVHTALIAPGSPLASVLRASGGWDEVYVDEVASIWTRE